MLFNTHNINIYVLVVYHILTLNLLFTFTRCMHFINYIGYTRIYTFYQVFKSKDTQSFKTISFILVIHEES